MTMSHYYKHELYAMLTYVILGLSERHRVMLYLFEMAPIN